MKLIHRHRFEASLARVSAMLEDDEFARVRAEAMGSAVLDVDVDRRSSGALVVCLKAAVPASSIPAEFRSFVGRDLAITYTEAWEPLTDVDRVGTFAVDVAGAPGHVAGAIGITADGAGTELLATGDVIASVPFVGAMIEKAVGGAVQKALAAEMTAADAWLAR